MIWAPFGLPKWFPNRFKSDPKTYQKIDRQIIENLLKMVPKMNPSHGIRNDHFWTCFDHFSGLFFSGCQEPPWDPQLTILTPNIDTQSSQNGAQEPPIATQSDSKHIFKIDRCLKAEFESRGSFQKRSTSKRCCGGVPRSVLN